MLMLANSQSTLFSDVEDMPREIVNTKHHNFVSSIKKKKLFKFHSREKYQAKEIHFDNQYEYI